MAKLFYRIVLELDGKEPIVLERDMKFTGSTSKVLVNESMVETRQAVERDLQEYMIKNPDLFEAQKRQVVKVMSPGGPQDAMIRKGDGTKR